MNATRVLVAGREALRRVGRTDDVSELEFVANDAPIESTIVEIGDTTIVRHVPVATTTAWLASHAIAALFVILIAAFGVFCHYYPWKLPPSPAQGSVLAEGPIVAGSDEHRTNPGTRQTVGQKARTTTVKSAPEVSSAPRRSRKSDRQKLASIAAAKSNSSDL